MLAHSALGFADALLTRLWKVVSAWLPSMAELKPWQEGISSLLGFFALMAAALYNFHLNRRRDKKLREQEALSVATALYGEIIVLRDNVAKLAQSVSGLQVWGQKNQKVDEYFLERHPLPEPALYKALAPKLGLMSADLLLAIIAFYREYENVCNALPLLIEKNERGYSYGETWVLVPARDAVRKVVPALRKIERMARVSHGAMEYDLGYTDTIIEIEEESRRDHSG